MVYSYLYRGYRKYIRLLENTQIVSGISQVVDGAIPLFYFSRENSSILRLGKTLFSPPHEL